MKILVLGTSEMFGNAVALYLASVGHEVTGMAQKRNPFFNSVIVDYLNFDAVKEVIQSGSYHAVINCSALLIKESETDKSRAILMNSYLPNFLAEITKDTKTMIVHRSTDCIFSGKLGKYSETAFPDALEFYGKTKALGELNDNKNLTLRTSIIGPDFNQKGDSLLNWFLQQEGPIKGYSKAMWTGVSSLVFAKAADAGINKRLTGLVNLVNGQSISKHDLLQLFNKYFRHNKLVINAYDNVVQDKSLINTRQDFNFVVPSYEEMVKEMAEWCQSHQDIYPDYYKF